MIQIVDENGNLIFEIPLPKGFHESNLFPIPVLDENRILTNVLTSASILCDRWDKIGLLIGVDEGDKQTLAFYLEVALQYLICYEVTSKSDMFTKYELVLFPILRLLFIENKLDRWYLPRKHEEILYDRLIDNYINQQESSKVSIDTIIYLKGAEFIRFLSALLKDLDNWTKTVWPPIAEELMKVTYSTLDVEAEQAHSYVGHFNFDRVVSYALVNTPPRSQP